MLVIAICLTLKLQFCSSLMLLVSILIKFSIDSDKTRPRMAKRERILTNLQLSSLPGIATFTDRAVIGMLKTFAGIHRDETLRKRWRDDIRLTYGVGSFHVEMIFGMNAGWAVEGAVGSDYKIDATYLSPHVNMASRMMSATKQYKVTILFSQAIEELMSDQARAKLRHIDTVTVKGSSVQQRIFTYDARHEGVDFFLFNISLSAPALYRSLYLICTQVSRK